MDESWRIPIGSMVPRRRSTEQTRRTAGPESLDADDFRDVFGGPPRTVLLHHFSGGDLTATSSASSSSSSYTCFDYLHRHGSRWRPSFYEEVFRPAPESGIPARDGGRNLPDFSIPEAGCGKRGGGGRRGVRTKDGFYDDIFGSGGGGGADRRSRTRSWKSTSKSKSSNASSVVSSEELSPLRPSIAHDAVLSTFAAKLRPITIPSRRASPSPTALPSKGEQSSHRTSCSTTVPVPRLPAGLMDIQFSGATTSSSNDPFRHHHELSRRYSPPETVVRLEPNSYVSFKKPVEDDDSDGDSGSPSSATSSVYDIPMATIRPCRSHEKAMMELEKEMVVVLEEDDEEEEEAGSSYVIELGVPGRRRAVETAAAEGGPAAAVDEAIAWAREKFQTKRLPEEPGVGEQISVAEKHEQVKSRAEEPPERRDEGMKDMDEHCVELLRNGYGDAPTVRGKDF